MPKKTKARAIKGSAVLVTQDAETDSDFIESICDWASRDQDECRQCGDSEKQAAEAVANGERIEKLRPLLLAAPDLLEAAKIAVRMFEDAKREKVFIWPSNEKMLPLRAAIAKAEKKA